MSIRFLLLLMPTTMFAEPMDVLPKAPGVASQPISIESVNQQFQNNNQQIHKLLDHISQKLNEVNQYSPDQQKVKVNDNTTVLTHKTQPEQQVMTSSSGTCKIDLSKIQDQYAQNAQNTQSDEATSQNSNQTQGAETQANAMTDDPSKATNTESSNDSNEATNSNTNQESNLVPANKAKLMSSLSELGGVINGISSSIVSLNQDITSGLKEAKILELQGNQDDAKQSLKMLNETSQKTYESLLSQQTQVDNIMSQINALLEGIDPSSMEQIQKALVKIQFNNNENKQDLKHIGKRLEQISPNQEDSTTQIK
ncbi:MAG: hypothetical protein CMF42_04420 [Legionellales bacterium]|nr:hypothetical protein [Legionellales bacterium]